MSKELPKHLAIGFIIAITLYVGGFSLDQWLRTRRGPWVLDFVSSPTLTTVQVNNHALGITNLLFHLVDEHPAPTNTTIRFDQPGRPIPFGKVVFEDLTFLPGTLTLDLLGHEIELLPRTLTVNRREVPWQSPTNIQLQPHLKPSPRPPPKPKRSPFRQ